MYDTYGACFLLKLHWLSLKLSLDISGTGPIGAEPVGSQRVLGHCCQTADCALAALRTRHYTSRLRQLMLGESHSVHLCLIYAKFQVGNLVRHY